MKHIRKITTSLTLTALLALGVATAAYAANNCGQVSEAETLYEAALHMRCNSDAVEYRSGKTAVDGCEGKKTVAAIRRSNDQIQYFMSGWAHAGKTAGAITQIVPEQTIAWAQTFGHTFEKDDYDQGLDGRFHASHSEPHALSQQQERLYEIGISSPRGTMCPKCRNLYQNFTQKIAGHNIVAVTKNWVYHFYHDGKAFKKVSRK